MARIVVQYRLDAGQPYPARVAAPFYGDLLGLHIHAAGHVAAAEDAEIVGDGPALRALAAVLVAMAEQVEAAQAAYDATRDQAEEVPSR